MGNLRRGDLPHFAAPAGDPAAARGKKSSSHCGPLRQTCVTLSPRRRKRKLPFWRREESLIIFHPMGVQIFNFILQRLLA
jgi:hypothetical protein